MWFYSPPDRNPIRRSYKVITFLYAGYCDCRWDAWSRWSGLGVVVVGGPIVCVCDCRRDAWRRFVVRSSSCWRRSRRRSATTSCRTSCRPSHWHSSTAAASDPTIPSTSWSVITQPTHRIIYPASLAALTVIIHIYWLTFAGSCALFLICSQLVLLCLFLYVSMGFRKCSSGMLRSRGPCGLKAKSLILSLTLSGLDLGLMASGLEYLQCTWH